MGYLSGGETVSITVSSADADWQAREEQEAREDLEERYGEAIVIQIGPAPEEEPADRGGDPGDPPSPTPSPTRTSPFRSPRRRPSAPPVPSAGPGITDYDDTDYGPNADGVTDYRIRTTAPSDGVTDYEAPD